MASATKKTRIKRTSKRKSMGKTRKAKEQNQGTTLSPADLFGGK